MAYLRKKGKNYFITFYYRGRKYDKSCRTNQRAVADNIRKQIEAQIANKTFRIESVKQTSIRTIDEFTKEYLDYSKINKARKTERLDRGALDNLKTHFGNVPMDSLTTQGLEQFKSALLKKYSPTSVNIVLRHLKAAFNKAVSWNYLESNPLKEVRQIRIPEKEGPFLTLKDVRKLRRKMKPGLYKDLIETGLYTGMRVSEIRNLSWDDIDFVGMKIRVRNTETFSTKSKKDRTVPLHPKLAKLLSLRAQVDHSSFVFLRADMEQVDTGTANKKFKEYCNKAKLDSRFHFHSLRHTFASHLAMSGVSLYFIQNILGHQSIETTAKTYAHLQPDPLLSAVKALKY